MAQIISQNSYDHLLALGFEIIPVIASFSKSGQIKPLYIRLSGVQYKVLTSWLKKSFSGQLEFHCEIVIDDRVVPITLTYFQKDMLWSIPHSLQE